MRKPFQVILLFGILSLFRPISTEAQKICRCSGTGQLSLFCNWYEEGLPNPGYAYGFIHTDDYGETITFFDTTNQVVQNIAGDRSPGLIYKLAGINGSFIQRSYVDGANWDTTKYNHGVSMTLFFEGNQAGELFLFNDYDHNLYQSIDSGASFQLISGLLPHCNGRLVAGNQPGVLLGIDTSRRFFRSFDNGQTFEYIPFPDETMSDVPTVSNFAFSITAGAVAEEVYVEVINNNGEVKVYQSLDYGSTFSHKTTFPLYQFDPVIYIAGRESNEFYAIRFRSLLYPGNSGIYTYDLEISHSSDGGTSFTTYNHLLYDEMFTGEIPVTVNPAISLSPNPAKGVVWLKNLPAGEAVTSIEIRNLSGQCVYNYNCSSTIIQGQSLQVDLPPTLAAGCYVVKVMAGARVIGNEKLMIAR